MAVTAHYFEKFQEQLDSKAASLSGGTPDTLKVGLVKAGTFNWVAATQAYKFVSDFLANSGSGGGGALTEETAAGYSRLTLSSVALTSSGLVRTLTCAAAQWTSVTFTDLYAFFYDASIGSTDASFPLICYWDFGGPVSATSGNYTLTPNASGLVTWTAS